MAEYTDVNELRYFVLEESWVLDIVARPATVDLTVDFVLAKDHPELRPARANEVYYSRRGVLPPAIDATAASDWGHIDSLTHDGDVYVLEGDFGRIQLLARALSVELSDPFGSAVHFPRQ